MKESMNREAVIFRQPREVVFVAAGDKPKVASILKSAPRNDCKEAVSERYEVCLAGAGGQGLILAGQTLAEAAIYDGKNATQSQSYGAEARGSASRSEVVISDCDIDYPRVIEADLLLAMSQEACDKYSPDLKEEGILVVDSVHVHRVPTKRAYCIPITKIAEEATGQCLTANVVALGIIVALTGIVSRKAIEASVRSQMPRGMEEMNLQALAAGFDEVERVLGED